MDRARRLAGAMLADLVGRLAGKSLLVSSDGHGGRWRMLDLVRAYALERLAASGEEALTRDRHLRWAAAAAIEIELEEQAAAGDDWRPGFDLIADDLRAALAGARAAARRRSPAGPQPRSSDLCPPFPGRGLHAL